jgi:hypothetical protein
MSNEKIFNEFSNLKIINKQKLIEYINFCKSQDLGKHIKFKTSHHHILPKAKNLPFIKYKNLIENPWNGVYLLHKDHYVAHHLLAQAIDHISITSSFVAMNNKDKYLRLDEIDLVTPEEFQIIMERQKKLFSKHSKESGLGKRIGLKTKESKMKPFINEDGNITNTYIENGKKISRTKAIKSRKFHLFHIEHGLIYKSISLNEIRKISNNLKSKTKENYMGKSNLSKGRLIAQNKEHFIGLYVIETLKENLENIDILVENIELKIKELNKCLNK